MQKLFVVEGEDVYSFPLLDSFANNKAVTNEILMPLAELLIKNDMQEFMKLAKSFGLYSESFCEGILKKYNKKSFFF